MGPPHFLNNELSLKTFCPRDHTGSAAGEPAGLGLYPSFGLGANPPLKAAYIPWPSWLPLKRMPMTPAAWRPGGGRWYRDHSEELDSLFDRLVRLGTRWAKPWALAATPVLATAGCSGGCYGEEVARFREAVRKYLVPVAEEIYRTQAKRLGKEYPMNFADNALTFRSGNPPRPVGNGGDFGDGLHLLPGAEPRDRGVLECHARWS